jgi:hypothetical protein
MNRTQTIVISAIVGESPRLALIQDTRSLSAFTKTGAIALFLVIYLALSWYKYNRSMRRIRASLQSGADDDEIHLQPAPHDGMSQYGKLPSDETLTEPVRLVFACPCMQP